LEIPGPDNKHDFPPKPLICKLWVSGRGLASDWQARESSRSQPVLEKQRRATTSKAAISVCEAAEGARKPEAVERRFIIRMADARKHAGCNSRDTIGASSAAGRPNVSGPNRCEERPESSAKQRHRSINREVNRTMVLGLINQDHCPDHSHPADGQ
jgi:hypothetical protein